MKSIGDPEGRRLPIKLDTTSNGEFEPVPLSPANRAANRLAHEAASRNAKRLGVSRRDFLVSACGAASALLAFNSANAAVGKRGGFFDLEAEAALEPQLAQARVGGKGEFIFDVQGLLLVGRYRYPLHREGARALGVKVICVHKGLPFGKQSYEPSRLRCSAKSS